MERATRDRLTGAVILVAIAAILVPEMLSGPGDDAARKTGTEALADTGPPLTTYEMSLDSSAPSRTVRPAQAEPEVLAEETLPPVEVDTPAPEPVAPSPTPAPEPARPKPATDRQVAQAAPQPARPAAQPSSPAPAPAAPAASSTTRAATTTATAPKPAAAPAAQGGWWVQVGSFSSDANANKLAGELRARGFAVRVSKVRSNNRDMFAVRAGPATDRTAANDLRSRLAAAGQQGFVVSP